MLYAVFALISPICRLLHAWGRRRGACLSWSQGPPQAGLVGATATGWVLLEASAGTPALERRLLIPFGCAQKTRVWPLHVAAHAWQMAPLRRQTSDQLLSTKRWDPCQLVSSKRGKGLTQVWPLPVPAHMRAGHSMQSTDTLLTFQGFNSPLSPLMSHPDPCSTCLI